MQSHMPRFIAKKTETKQVKQFVQGRQRNKRQNTFLDFFLRREQKSSHRNNTKRAEHQKADNKDTK